MQHKEKIKNDIYLRISKNLKYYRRINKLTQKELAIKSGYSYAYIRRLEDSKSNKSFSLQTIYNLAEALNIDIRQLFDDMNI